MNRYAADELAAARRPIASLLSKSEKAVEKVRAGTWQHTMLSENIAALRVGCALLDGNEERVAGVSADELERALTAFASMIDRTEGSKTRFAPGTPQHSLQRNRLAALRIAQALARSALDAAKGDPCPTQPSEPSC